LGRMDALGVVAIGESAIAVAAWMLWEAAVSKITVQSTRNIERQMYFFTMKSSRKIVLGSLKNKRSFP
jgi:hypothetical protein